MNLLADFVKDNQYDWNDYLELLKQFVWDSHNNLKMIEESLLSSILCFAQIGLLWMERHELMYKVHHEYKSLQKIRCDWNVIQSHFSADLILEITRRVCFKTK